MVTTTIKAQVEVFTSKHRHYLYDVHSPLLNETIDIQCGLFNIFHASGSVIMKQKRDFTLHSRLCFCALYLKLCTIIFLHFVVVVSFLISMTMQRCEPKIIRNHTKCKALSDFILMRLTCFVLCKIQEEYNKCSQLNGNMHCTVKWRQVKFSSSPTAFFPQLPYFLETRESECNCN